MTQEECMAELKRRKYANPFRPFVIKTTDGKSHPVTYRQAFAGAGSWMMVCDEREHRTNIRVSTVDSIADLGVSA